MRKKEDLLKETQRTETPKKLHLPRKASVWQLRGLGTCFLSTNPIEKLVYIHTSPIHRESVASEEILVQKSDFHSTRFIKFGVLSKTLWIKEDEGIVN